MAEKPSIPKGTRDFSPDEMVKRNYIFDTIRTVFSRYGYLPIETPAMENLSSLLGKYGEEGDRLLFKILNSGDFLAGVTPGELEKESTARLSTRICEKGLRYDLTVPFARYVVQHRNDLTFPFKRYQIQPVWRADRPQKGRYREFYQCDVDVIGSDSLLNEVEMIQITDDIFQALGMNILIRLNNRKILAGISETIGEKERMMDITLAIDKFSKIGLENVTRELAEKGVSAQAVEMLQLILLLTGTREEKMQRLQQFLRKSGTGLRGLEEMHYIFDLMERLTLTSLVEFDITLARGLNYYTGTIIEVISEDMDIGSVAGGGRYDDLTGIFGLPEVSGVGISFGADRIYDVLHQTGGFTSGISATTTLLFVNFGPKEEKHCLTLLEKIRRSGIPAELYPDAVKMKKQMSYANSRNIPFVAIVGEAEIGEDTITLKNMSTGEQQQLSPEEVIRTVSTGDRAK